MTDPTPPTGPADPPNDLGDDRAWAGAAGDLLGRLRDVPPAPPELVDRQVAAALAHLDGTPTAPVGELVVTGYRPVGTRRRRLHPRRPLRPHNRAIRWINPAIRVK